MYAFAQLPLVFYDDRKFDGLNAWARELYTLLRDRLSLSFSTCARERILGRRESFRAPTGEVYVVFTRQEMVRKLRISEPSVRKAIKALKAAGLIYEKRQGLGRANLIFVREPNGETVAEPQNETPLQPATNPQAGTQQKPVSRSHINPSYTYNKARLPVRETAQHRYTQREYTEEELNALVFNVLDKEEVKKWDEAIAKMSEKYAQTGTGGKRTIPQGNRG